MDQNGLYTLFSQFFAHQNDELPFLFFMKKLFWCPSFKMGPTIVCCVHTYPIFRPVLSATSGIYPPSLYYTSSIFRGNGLFTRRHVLMVIKIPFVSAIHRSPKFVVLRSTLNWVLFHLEPFSSNMHFYTSRSLWDPKPKIPNLKSVLCWHFVLQAADALPVGCGSPIL